MPELGGGGDSGSDSDSGNVALLQRVYGVAFPTKVRCVLRCVVLCVAFPAKARCVLCCVRHGVSESEACCVVLRCVVLRARSVRRTRVCMVYFVLIIAC